MNRPVRVLQAAALAAAVAYQVLQNRAHRNEDRIHEGDLETHQVHIDRLNAKCGITGDVLPPSAIRFEERLANDEVCEALEEANWTQDELDEHAVIESLFPDGGQS